MQGFRCQLPFNPREEVEEEEEDEERDERGNLILKTRKLELVSPVARLDKSDTIQYPAL